MQYTQKIKESIRVAIRVHELDQKQKRKGKDVPYVIHPLVVGLILSRISKDEDVVVAGILHDTVEDSVDTKKVTVGMIKKRFGEEVSKMVDDVTEKNRHVPWLERKKQNVKKIATLPKNSLLIKAADTVANCTELISDFRREGDDTFRRFNVPKENLIEHYVEIIEAIKKAWPNHPLRSDLDYHLSELRAMY
ncbi:MAG: HD domain-containing protein [Candidatus Paceibacterota bacterium]|jgi:(p)ppGpp synthase/HD superfamily hydrolase